MTRSLLIIPFVLIIIFYPGLSTTFSQLSFCCLLLERASRKWRWFSCERRPCRVNGHRRFTREMCRHVGEMPTRRQQKRRCRGCSHRVITSVTRRDVGRRCRAPDRRSSGTLRPHPCCFFYSFFKAFCEKWLRYFKKIILSVIWIQLIIQEGEWV